MFFAIISSSLPTPTPIDLNNIEVISVKFSHSDDTKSEKKRSAHKTCSAFGRQQLPALVGLLSQKG